jgi:hypothetical protein
MNTRGVAIKEIQQILTELRGVSPVIEQHSILIGTAALSLQHASHRLPRDLDVLIYPDTAAEVAELANELASRYDMDRANFPGSVFTLKTTRRTALPVSSRLEIDLIASNDGLVPATTARMVSEAATTTKFGPVANPADVFAMKLVSWGDRALRRGPISRLEKYRNDVQSLVERQTGWDRVRLFRLLESYPSKRRDTAIGLFHQLEENVFD